MNSKQSSSFDAQGIDLMGGPWGRGGENKIWKTLTEAAKGIEENLPKRKI